MRKVAEQVETALIFAQQLSKACRRFSYVTTFNLSTRQSFNVTKVQNQSFVNIIIKNHRFNKKHQYIKLYICKDKQHFEASFQGNTLTWAAVWR